MKAQSIRQNSNSPDSPTSAPTEGVSNPYAGIMQSPPPAIRYITVREEDIKITDPVSFGSLKDFYGVN